MITLAKLRRILELVDNFGGTLRCTGGYELAIEFTGQLEKSQHQRLLRWGFLYCGGEYIYRPIIRSKKPCAKLPPQL